MVIAGTSGAATSILHKMKAGSPISVKDIAIDVALASCAMVLAYIVSEIAHLGPEYSRAVYFGAGWLGSRLISVVEKRANKALTTFVDKLIDKI